MQKCQQVDLGVLVQGTGQQVATGDREEDVSAGLMDPQEHEAAGVEDSRLECEARQAATQPSGSVNLLQPCGIQHGQRQ